MPIPLDLLLMSLGWKVVYGNEKRNNEVQTLGPESVSMTATKRKPKIVSYATGPLSKTEE
jgi:hypothetical protein